MSTVHILTTELSNLISQTKRRNPELRLAAEKSLDVLKTFKGADEKQFLKRMCQKKNRV